jgi:hypothetical protein
VGAPSVCQRGERGREREASGEPGPRRGKGESRAERGERAFSLSLSLDSCLLSRKRKGREGVRGSGEERRGAKKERKREREKRERERKASEIFCGKSRVAVRVAGSKEYGFSH